MEGIKDSVKYEKKLSIIVPVYNVEKYLERCVNSLLDQDLPFEEYEIILINDGSTDNSYEIAKRLAGEHDNIVLLTQDNHGQSVARNRGIDVARGKYIMFVDSDDYVQGNILAKLISIATNYQLEICIYQCLAKWTDGSLHDDMRQSFKTGIVVSGEQLLLQGYEVSSIWNCLYLKSLINNVKFVPGILHEDVEFNMRIYPLAKRVMLTDEYCYYYCIHKESSTHGFDSKKICRSIHSDIIVASRLKDVSDLPQYSERIKQLFVRKSRSLTVSTLISLIRAKRLNPEEKQECLVLAKNEGVYPVRGRTLSWKTTFLIPFLNCVWLYRYLLR